MFLWIGWDFKAGVGMEKMIETCKTWLNLQNLGQGHKELGLALGWIKEWIKVDKNSPPYDSFDTLFLRKASLFDPSVTWNWGEVPSLDRFPSDKQVIGIWFREASAETVVVWNTNVGHTW